MVKITNFFKGSYTSSFSVKKCTCIFLVLFVCSLVIHAQTTLTGYVLDEKTKEPVTGATIVEQATTNGSSTDADGRFDLKVSGRFPLKLSIRLIGYKDREVIVKNATDPVNIYLTEDINALNEVVVVGYGTQRRKELTGAVASVSKATLEQPATSVNELLGGSIAGLNVSQNSGSPEQGRPFVSVAGIRFMQAMSRYM